MTAVENLGCHFPPHNAGVETTGTAQHQCFSGKTDFHGNKTDFAISPNYVGGGQEGDPIADPEDCPNLVDHVFQEYARDDFQITDQHYFAVR